MRVQLFDMDFVSHLRCDFQYFSFLPSTNNMEKHVEISEQVHYIIEKTKTKQTTTMWNRPFQSGMFVCFQTGLLSIIS